MQLKGPCDVVSAPEYVRRRGPDATSRCLLDHQGHSLLFVGSVLWLQGKTVIPQPITSADGSVLLWNGDVYNLNEFRDKGDLNDGQWLLDQLQDCRSDKQILEIFCKIKGPWSFVFFKKSAGELFFGKDCFGRHSLLWSYGARELNQLILCSTGNQDFLREVPALGIFKLDLNQAEPDLILHPWDNNQKTEEFKVGQSLPHPVKSLNRCLPQNIQSIDSLQGFLEQNPELITHLGALLENSVKVRVTLLPRYCRVCMCERLANHNPECGHSKVAILFSGGLDSTVLTALAHRCLPESESVDLLNVAFEQVDKKGREYEVPDRISGREAFEEVRNLFPRRWNYVEIDITRKELDTWRSSRIADLVHPLTSILDESLGCALWFATRGAGNLVSAESESAQYTSEARVILVGSGADEQLGGYSRHANKFRTDGWQGLIDEIDLDISRISSRNLGRDDRVISDHGRSGRPPFLDENLVDFLNLLPIEKKMDLRLPRGVGDKIILRALAWKLGLFGTAVRPKRAMQFGTKIAKSSEKGSDVSKRMFSSE